MLYSGDKALYKSSMNLTPFKPGKLVAMIGIADRAILLKKSNRSQ